MSGFPILLAKSHVFFELDHQFSVKCEVGPTWKSAIYLASSRWTFLYFAYQEHMRSSKRVSCSKQLDACCKRRIVLWIIIHCIVVVIICLYCCHYKCHYMHTLLRMIICSWKNNSDWWSKTILIQVVHHFRCVICQSVQSFVKSWGYLLKSLVYVSIC